MTAKQIHDHFRSIARQVDAQRWCAPIDREWCAIVADGGCVVLAPHNFTDDVDF
jgi:hypothetical protein